MATFPELPKIAGDPDIILDIFTHSSVEYAGIQANNEYGPRERLALIGQDAFRLSISHHLFRQKPLLSAHQLQEYIDEYQSSENLADWTDKLGLMAKLRYGRGVEVHSPETKKTLFLTYLGGLYVRNGLDSIITWVNRVINPHADTPPEPSHQSSPLPAQNMWSTPNGAVPPSTPPPPLPPSNPYGTNMITLALVNQTAAQRGLLVTYPAQQSGPPHQPTWTVQCCMNGQLRGQGSGPSQKKAKEIAAQQAWASMGW